MGPLWPPRSPGKQRPLVSPNTGAPLHAQEGLGGQEPGLLGSRRSCPHSHHKGAPTQGLGCKQRSKEPRNRFPAVVRKKQSPEASGRVSAGGGPRAPAEGPETPAWRPTEPPLPPSRILVGASSTFPLPPPISLQQEKGNGKAEASPARRSWERQARDHERRAPAPPPAPPARTWAGHSRPSQRAGRHSEARPGGGDAPGGEEGVPARRGEATPRRLQRSARGGSAAGKGASRGKSLGARRRAGRLSPRPLLGIPDGWRRKEAPRRASGGAAPAARGAFSSPRPSPPRVPSHPDRRPPRPAASRRALPPAQGHPDGRGARTPGFPGRGAGRLPFPEGPPWQGRPGAGRSSPQGAPGPWGARSGRRARRPASGRGSPLRSPGCQPFPKGGGPPVSLDLLAIGQDERPWLRVARKPGRVPRMERPPIGKPPVRILRLSRVHRARGSPLERSTLSPSAYEGQRPLHEEKGRPKDPGGGAPSPGEPVSAWGRKSRGAEAEEKVLPLSPPRTRERPTDLPAQRQASAAPADSPEAPGWPVRACPGQSAFLPGCFPSSFAPPSRRGPARLLQLPPSLHWAPVWRVARPASQPASSGRLRTLWGGGAAECVWECDSTFDSGAVASPRSRGITGLSRSKGGEALASPLMAEPGGEIKSLCGKRCAGQSHAQDSPVPLAPASCYLSSRQSPTKASGGPSPGRPARPASGLLLGREGRRSGTRCACQQQDPTQAL